MSKLAGLTGAQGAGLAVVVVGAVVAVVTGVFSPTPKKTPKPAMPETAIEAALQPKSDPVPEAKAVEPVVAEPVVTPQPEPKSAPTAEVEAPPVTAPTFDVVRVEPDGSATIAGRADPGATVAIELDGQEVGRVLAGSDGSFVQFLEIEPSANPRLVRLKVMLADGGQIYSEANALIAPMVVAQVAPEPVVAGAAKAAEPSVVAEPEVVAAAPVEPAPSEPMSSTPEVVDDPKPVVAAAPAADAEPEPIAPAPVEVVESEPVVVASVAPKVAPVPEPVVDVAPEPEATAVNVPKPKAEPEPVATQEQVQAPEPVAPEAPAVIISSSEGVKVVQPLSPAPEVMSAVALDTISYSDQGDVQLAGRGQGEGFVRVYVDNRPVTTSRIEADGAWRSGLPDVDTGVYTLRVDELNPAGEVVSRVETPFKREAQEVVAEAGQVKAITVQPGNTLWAIAQDNYGAGNLYLRLFEANKERIRNPDLIYPGQVFDIPRD